MHYSEKNLPFGGVGESGMGAYHGKEGENRLRLKCTVQTDEIKRRRETLRAKPGVQLHESNRSFVLVDRLLLFLGFPTIQFRLFEPSSFLCLDCPLSLTFSFGPSSLTNDRPL